MRVWIDIENAPQVQYLVPLKSAFERTGASVFLTARDQGMTADLLDAKGVTFAVIGKGFGRSAVKKASGLLGRAIELRKELRAAGSADVLVCSSRAASLAARAMRIPSYIFCDYEHVELRVFRASGAVLLHPKVIQPSAFTTRGIPARRLMAFPGIKEDLTFGDIVLDEVEAHSFGAPREQGHVYVLFRPPAEESHYHRSESRALAAAVLERLAQRNEVVVVFSPRYSWQASQLESPKWRNQPILLERAVPFAALLKAVDAVVSAGGTMLREAAYLGVPAYSLFRGPMGGVDRYLASLGALSALKSADDLPNLHPRDPRLESRVPRTSDLANRMTQMLIQRAQLV